MLGPSLCSPRTQKGSPPASPCSKPNVLALSELHCGPSDSFLDFTRKSLLGKEIDSQDGGRDLGAIEGKKAFHFILSLLVYLCLAKHRMYFGSVGHPATNVLGSPIGEASPSERDIACVPTLIASALSWTSRGISNLLLCFWFGSHKVAKKMLVRKPRSMLLLWKDLGTVGHGKTNPGQKEEIRK